MIIRNVNSGGESKPLKLIIIPSYYNMDMQNSKDIIRDQEQQEAIETLKVRKRVILNWGTGVGKSRVAVKAIEALCDENKSVRILLMVQETAHKLNWRKEMVEALGEDKTKKIEQKITMDCYASLQKHRNTEWDLIVFDEGHHLRSQKRQEIVMTMKAERVLILTATISDKNDGDLMIHTLVQTFGQFTFLKIGLQDAIDSGILGKPEIHLIPVVLDNKQLQKYEELTEYFNEKKSEYFQERKKLGIPFDGPDNAETLELKRKWLNSGGRRKKMLGHAKTRVARIIINTKLAGKRFICFCTSLDQIGWLNGTNFVSSENSAAVNKANIEAFNNGSAHSLFAMGMLQEGQNLAGIEAGLIVQLDGKERPFIQKFGRVMRSKTPVQYILYVRDTHDENYLQNALAGLDKQYIIEEDPMMTDGSPAPSVFGSKKMVDRIGEKEEMQNEKITLPSVSAEWVVNQTGGQFVSLKGGMVNALAGSLVKILPDGRDFMIYLNDKQNNLEHVIRLNKKLSFSLLAPMKTATSDELRNGIKIIISTDSKWANYEVFVGKRKLRWDGDDMKAYKASNDKTEYMDSLVGHINNKLDNKNQ